MTDDAGFLSRWSRRKVQAREGAAPPEAATVAPPLPQPPASIAAVRRAPVAVPAAAAEPPPTLADVAQLARDSDYTRFVAPGVEPDVKNAALKKLFGDPHFNVMDGLDTYIDDYNRADPLPASMLRQMVQAKALGLFTDDDEADASEAAPTKADTAPALAADTPPSPLEASAHEDTDLRLQPHDAAGRPGPEPGAGQDGGREH